ncbi:membrane-associated calcium-binding protein, putative [Perkinsus marinus ATCC 50983]|uniref:Membrane-associated calcium-binding protein, putative n=1 Tax=Perkinsus marinus (strain ATCC 50983 / TXsc) TaxID=423536 RepID=C5KH57_PERM5|nr:membrane-associated calcium-binding protein, putative [Perkinsus marinus ATCC 50983]EER15919.1 membrane-associated calcium-binding protein, putative [Perkinsus marinus ATCC 50983]|eukprot:XP_002784123.1 membrane-associated calcium-binding protein, putative [Perkinsus marinus ATCC 50983]
MHFVRLSFFIGCYLLLGRATAEEDLSDEDWDAEIGEDETFDGDYNDYMMGGMRPLEKDQILTLFEKHLDIDEDGLVTLEEMGEVTRKTARLEFRQQIEADKSSFDTDGDGAVSLEELLALYDLGEGGPSGELRQQWIEANTHSLEKLFRVGDVDSDGHLSFDEFVSFFIPTPGSDLAETVVVTDFTYRDLNQDGKLDANEALKEKHGADDAGEVEGSEFRKYDADGDGYWSLEEFEVYSRDLESAHLEPGRNLLELIDGDGDGKISMEELEEALEDMEKFTSLRAHPFIQSLTVLLLPEDPIGDEGEEGAENIGDAAETGHPEDPDDEEDADL